jgi:hypothetical protein
MSDFADEFYEEDDQPNESNPVRARMKQLEKETRDLRKQVAEAQAAQKELAFVKAGLDLNSPMAKYFVKGYDGELSPEAIRLAAEEAQLITPQPTVTDSDKAGWQESNRIAAGSETAPPPPSWAKRIADANSESELMAVFAEAQAQGIDLTNL